MKEANIELLKKGYEAFAKGDLDVIRGMSAADCVWRTPGFEPFKPEYKGIEGTIEYLTKLFEATDGTFKVVPETFVGDDERVVVLSRVTASRMGRMLDTHVVHIYDVHDGKVFETTEFAAEPKKLESFWA